MSVSETIASANSFLPGNPVPAGEDRRWQAIVEVGDYIETEPEEVWRFVRRWGSHPQEDLRDALIFSAPRYQASFFVCSDQR